MEFEDWLLENKFIKAENSVEHAITDRYIFNGNIEIGKYKVAFGYRLRAGYIENEWTELDICCGDIRSSYDGLFYTITHIIASNPPYSPFHNIPQWSRIKPYFKDTEFTTKIADLFKHAKK